MAIGMGGKVLIEESGYLSDESDFYGTAIIPSNALQLLTKSGDEITKQEFELSVIAFDPAEWWEHRLATLMEVAEENLKTEKPVQAVKLYNPYEGQRYAWQLSETVGEFLARLRPASTMVSNEIPW